MKVAGTLLMLLGLIGYGLCFSADTTVAVSGGTRVHNLHLASQRQVYLIVSDIAFIGGAVLYGFNPRRN